MDNSSNHRVIRVQIDHPTHASAANNTGDTSGYTGFLGAELGELEAALLAGRHLDFSWLPWAAKSKDAVVTNVTPSSSHPVTPGVLEFQQQVHADMLRMLDVLQTMARIMAGEMPQPMPAAAALLLSTPPSAPPPAAGPTGTAMYHYAAGPFSLPPTQAMPNNCGSFYSGPATQVFSLPPTQATPKNCGSVYSGPAPPSHHIEIEGFVNGRSLPPPTASYTGPGGGYVV